MEGGLDEARFVRALAMQVAIANSWRPPSVNPVERAEAYAERITAFMNGGAELESLRAHYEKVYVAKELDQS